MSEKAAKESASQAAAQHSPLVSPLATPLALLARQFGNQGFGRIVQAKLQISDPDDAFEHEADRVADQVMRMPDSSVRASKNSAPAIQRLCGECGEELHRSEDSARAVPTVDSATENSINSLSNRGSGLPESVRSFMEPRFNANFSSVRVHDDAHAHDLARNVNAKAFTVGPNVVFGAGHYSPDTDDGKRLLAHELTHVVQQGAARTSPDADVQRKFDHAATMPLVKASQATRALQRRIGWTEPVGTWNKDQQTLKSGWLRVPLEGFSEGNQNRDVDNRAVDDAAGRGKDPLGRAVVVMSNKLDAKSPVRILIHYHGLTSRSWDPYEGYRERATADKDLHIAAGTVRDVALDRVDEQLKSANDPQLMALLVQGTGNADFGKPDVDKYIGEAFQFLFDGKVLAAVPPNYTVTISLHSAGMRTVRDMIEEEAGAFRKDKDKHAKFPAHLDALVLFEAINSWEQRDVIEKWLDRQLDALDTKLRAAPDAKAREDAVYEVPGLRGYFTTNGVYGPQYKKLKKYLDDALAKHATSFGNQAAAIARRYSIEEVTFDPKDLDGKSDHERLIGGVPGHSGSGGGAIIDAFNQLARPAAKVAPATGSATIQRQAAPAPAVTAAEREAARAREEHDALIAQMESSLIGMTLDEWMADMRADAKFLGLAIHGSYGAGPGVHQQMLDKLQIAERALRARPEFDGMNDAQIRSQLGITDVGGLRAPRIATGGSQVSWHSFGLAVDINASTNPFVGNAKVNEQKLRREHHEDLIPIYKENRSPRIVERAMLLRYARKDFNVEDTAALNIRDAAHYWDYHHEASDALAWYLSLASDLASRELADKVTALNTAGDTRDLAWWQERIRSDVANIPNYDFEHSAHPERTGYMDLPRSLIEAMDSAGLNWGGAYPGAKDIMHFDYHSPSINRSNPGAHARPPARPAAPARPPAQVQRMPESRGRSGTSSVTAVRRVEDSSSSAPMVDAATEESIHSLSSRGSELPSSIRSFMEPRFQADFSNVRIHTDARAHDLARSVQAKAFTVGHNVVFAAGQYAPDSDHGKRLLAHELAHVVQQSGATHGHSPAIASRHDVIHRSPDFGPAQPQFTPPESVGEMADMLEEAENMLVDPVLLDRRARLRLYGANGAPKDWKPDAEGALRRVDAALDFVKPLVQQANIKQHGNDSLKTSVLGLYYSTEWLQRAKDDYEEVSRLRSQSGAAGVRDLVTKARSVFGFRSPAAMKVLADESLSFELESGSSPRPAPEFRSQLRQQFPDGATLGKRELRVLAWLSNNKDVILKAERDFRVDRRAIAAAIAWEAMENVMRGSPRSAGPGKMHTYSNATASVLPVSKAAALPQQLEELGLVPKPKDDDDRDAILRMPQGSITYIAAAMRAAADIAAKHGYDISHEMVALTSFYQGHDLPSWEKHMAEKQRKKEAAFIAADPMAKWTLAHFAYLETALGSPIY